MTKNAKICRSFRQDFPEFVARAEALGVHIRLEEGRRKGRERVFWLDGYKQLTGYTTRSDGLPFTRVDAEKNINKALTEIEEDRKEITGVSVRERFHRVMTELRQMVPQYRMIGEVRLPCGDSAHCFFMADFEGDVRLHGIDGAVARAKAEWRRDENQRAQLERFCDLLEVNFSARQAGSTQ